MRNEGETNSSGNLELSNIPDFSGRLTSLFQCTFEKYKYRPGWTEMPRSRDPGGPACWSLLAASQGIIFIILESIKPNPRDLSASLGLRSNMVSDKIKNMVSHNSSTSATSLSSVGFPGLWSCLLGRLVPARSRRTPKSGRALLLPLPSPFCMWRALFLPRPVQRRLLVFYEELSFMGRDSLQGSFFIFASFSIKLLPVSLSSKLEVPCALCFSKLFFWQGQKCRPVMLK